MTPIIIGIGEVLWDLLPGGRQLGGAPANFAYHAHALGAEAHVISAVGDDDLGREILVRLRSQGLGTESMKINRQAPTGTVSVTLGDDGQPSYTIHEDVAWDFLDEEQGRALVSRANAICFGTLAQRSEQSRRAIYALVKGTPAGALRILDLNLRQSYFSPENLEQSLQLANVLKLNDTELSVLANFFGFSRDQRHGLATLAERYSLRLVALTRGERGSLLFSEGTFAEHAAKPTKVVDTIGAGDAFTATMVMGLLSGWTLSQINETANEVAAFVCSCPGATPELPDELRKFTI